jgi:kynurenine formamidase
MSRRRLLCLLLPILVAALWMAPPPSPADDLPPARKKLTKADVEAMMTSLSNWGRWGKDDQRGALNLITPEKRRQAAALVQEGVTLSLARAAIKEPVDDSPAFVHRMVSLPREGQEIASSADEYTVRYHGFTQTHLDGLCHLIYKGHMYNGFSQKELTAAGAHKLGIEQFRNGIFTRGVLMDLPQLFGARFLPGTRAIYPEDLEAWERKAGIKVESGDAILIRTGRWTRRELDGPWSILKGSAGLHASCLPWLKKRDVAVVGSDLALDVLPSGIDGFDLPVHWVCGVAMGTPILDNCDLEPISMAASARKRWTFLLTVAPLVVEGGTGSPVNPLATY